MKTPSPADWEGSGTLLPPVVAFGLATALTPLLAVALRRWRVIDHPNPRSSHSAPTPRGGGVAVAVAVLVAALISRDLSGAVRTGVLVAGVAFAVVGLVEDVVGIPALRRLALLFVVAAATIPWLLTRLSGPGVWRVLFAAGVVLWLVSYVNAFNFMDGINGLAAGQTIVAGLTWYLVGQHEGALDFATLGLIASVAALGFLPYNFPRARVFLGDTGSYFLGAILGFGAVLGLRAGIAPEAVLAPLALYLADTAVTIVRRVARGERWYEPHRKHAYQRLTRHFDGSHTRTTALVVAVITACAVLGALSLLDSLGVRLLGDVGVLGVLTAYVCGPSVLARARRQEPVLA